MIFISNFGFQVNQIVLVKMLHQIHFLHRIKDADVKRRIIGIALNIVDRNRMLTVLLGQTEFAWFTDYLK